MLKQKLKFKKVLSQRSGMAALLVLLVAGMTGGLVVHADQYDQKIQALENNNAARETSLGNLQIQASNYQDAINQLQGRIDEIEGQILTTQAKQDAVKKKIVTATAQLNHQKQVLGDAIKTMYIEGQTSTLEVLLSSNNLSDFVNQEQYHLTVENNVKTLVDKITALKIQLKKQNDELASLLNDQKTQQAKVEADKAEQNQLLSYNQSQQDNFNQQIQANNSQIAKLRAEQLAANQSLGGVPVAGDPNHGGYPAQWADATQDSLVDSWGMLNRECVSYTAWKVFQTYGYMPYWGGSGNANQWVGNAQAAGIPTGSTPKVHSVAIWNVGSYGHAMWVEAVNGDNIYVSQYNFDLQGHYSEMSIPASGLTYIYFGSKY